MAKNHIFSTGSNYSSTYYGKGSNDRSAAAKKGWYTRRKNVWNASNEKKGQTAHNRVKNLMAAMTESQKKSFRDFYNGIRSDEKGVEYPEEDLDDLFAIGDVFFTGEDIDTFIKTLDQKYGDLW